MLQLQAVGGTSTDDNHPVEHCIDGNSDTFWLSTGLFPQELVLSLPSPTRIISIHLRCCNVKEMCVQSSSQATTIKFTKLVKSEFQSQVGHLQSEQFKLESPVLTKHLKFIVTKAYTHFVSLHSISVTPS